MHTIKEKVSNAAAAAQEHIDIMKAKAEESVQFSYLIQCVFLKFNSNMLHSDSVCVCLWLIYNMFRQQKQLQRQRKREK